MVPDNLGQKSLKDLSLYHHIEVIVERTSCMCILLKLRWGTRMFMKNVEEKEF